jgi:hypothetical protein
MELIILLALDFKALFEMVDQLIYISLLLFMCGRYWNADTLVVSVFKPIS